MTKGIKIAKNLTLDLDVVVEATAVVGKRGRGKTYTAKRIVEEALRAGVTCLVIDPTDVWHGLTSGVDGTAQGGLDVLLVGGKHGVLPARVGAGKVLARLVLDGTSVVLCPKGLPKGDRRRLVGETLTELYDRAEGMPILVVIDEADEYAPEGARSFSNKTVDPLVLSQGAVEDIVRRGRAGGLGSLLITQRVAVLSKDVLTQSDTLIALGVTGKNDIDAVALWISRHASDLDKAKEITSSLPSLPKGVAWVWSPEYGVLDRVEVLPITTFDSSRSPKVGEVVTEPKSRKALNLEALGEEMARFAEEVKADDPAELRKRIRELERDLAARPVADAEPVEVKVPVEVPVVDADARTELTTAVDRLAAMAESFDQAFAIGERIAKLLADAGGGDGRPDVPRARPTRDSPRPVAQRQSSGRAAQRPDPPARRQPDRPPVSRAASAEGLSKSQEAMLDALAWFESVRIKAPTRGQVAWQSGVSPKSSGFEKNCSTLRTRGLIHFPGTNRLGLTDTGRDVAVPPAVPPTSEALQASILARVSESQRTMLTVLIDVYPGALTRDELADRCVVSARSSGFEKNISTLRSLGLVDFPEQGYVAGTELLWID